MACPDDNLIVAMAEQALEPAQFAELEEHIDGCENCRKLLAVALADSSLAVGTPVDDEASALASFVDASINDRYVVKALLGRGGMGAVYLARDLTLDREVALKLHKAGSGSQRLHREAMAMAKLAHPNVVTVFEVATVEDRLYVAMEYVRGDTLRGWLAAAPRTWRQIVAMLLETGNGLAAAHAAGLVHRDFKPENVLVGDDGRPRVGDFGLARVEKSPSTTFRKYVPSDVLAQSAETAETVPVTPGLDVGMTQTGALLGTPAYMAPEQLAAEAIDARCDQFAFCVVAWECLYGKRPFTGKTLTALQLAIDDREIQEPTRTSVPQRVRAVLERGLATAPADRYRDMPSLLGALREASAPRTKRRVAMGLGAVAAVTAAGLGIASFVVKRRHEAACAAAGDDVRRAFDDSRRAAISTAFGATGAPFAVDSAARAADVLGRYSSLLATRTESVCRGTGEAPQIVAAKRSCLADRKQEITAFADQLRSPDKALVQRAASAAWGLYDPDPCNDAPTLLARSAHATPSSADDIAAMRHVTALEDAGRYTEGIPAAAALVAATHAHKDRTLELDAQLSLAQMQSHTEVPEARKSFEQAIELAETLGRDLDAAGAYSALANYEGTVAHHPADAHRFIDLARAKLERLGGTNPALHGELLGTEAQVLYDENRLGEAETAMLQAVATLKAAYGADHPKLGAAYGTLSEILRAEHKTGDAEVISERTLAILERALGPDHPNVAGAHMNLAQDLMTQKRFTDAREHLMRADIVFARVFGEVHPMRAAIAGNLGALEQELGNWDASLAASRRAVSILEQVEGPDSADVSGARRDVARELAKAGRPAEAVAEQLRALQILDKLGPDVEGRVVSCLNELAEYEIDAHQPLPALEHAQRAVALGSKRRADANPMELEDAKLLLANALWDSKKDRARARQLVEEVRGTTDPTRRVQLDKWLVDHAK